MSATPNYITREGAEQLQHELTRLRREERPVIVLEVSDAAAQGDRSENAEYIYGKKKLREIDRRLGFLLSRLERVEIVTPSEPVHGKAAFGHWVTVQDEEGKCSSYRLVGEDEISLPRGDISWKSPLARAVIGKQKGATVTVLRPSGPVDLELIEVSLNKPSP